jgi:hypothetical protein
MEADSFKIEPAVYIHGGNNVLEGGNDSLCSSDLLLLKSKGNRRQWNLGRGRGRRTCSRFLGDGQRGAEHASLSSTLKEKKREC